MEQQGTPIGSSAQGKKVCIKFPTAWSPSFGHLYKSLPPSPSTQEIQIDKIKIKNWQNTTDPEGYQNPKEEGAGVIAKDSLAAESTRTGGAFGENNRNASISGSSSNPADTDVSGATTLPRARDATERLDKDHRETSDDVKGPGGQKYPEGTDGLGEFPGKHSAASYSGGSTKAKQELGLKVKDAQTQSTGSEGKDTRDGRDTNGAYNQDRSETASRNTSENISHRSTENLDKPSHGDTAPSYVTSVTSHPAQSGKPKGRNITEGDIENEDPSNNASFTAEIGSKDDPGRLALKNFQLQTEAAAVGGGPRQGGAKGDGQYGVLEDDQVV